MFSKKFNEVLGIASKEKTLPLTPTNLLNATET